jgi:hypothetical protein
MQLITSILNLPKPDITTDTKDSEAETINRFWGLVDNPETANTVLLLILDEINNSLSVRDGETALVMLGRLQGHAKLINIRDTYSRSLENHEARRQQALLEEEASDL